MAGVALAGKVALITAAGGSIGTTCALRFAAEGARVACADVSLEAASASAARIDGALPVGVDVLNAADCQRAVDAVVERFGRLDVLVNLVGYFGPRGGGWANGLDVERWDWMMDINLKSVFMASKHAIPAMLRSGGGAIVNTGTIAAVIGSDVGAYGASKSGVLALTRAMAADYVEQGIRVNCVCSSATDTPMYWQSSGPNRRREDVVQSVQGLSTPDQIAAALLYLASDELSPRVNGQVLVADGGFTVIR